MTEDDILKTIEEGCIPENLTYKQTSDMIKQTYPDIWKSVNWRRYKNMDRYCSPATANILYTSSIGFARDYGNDELPEGSKNVYLCACLAEAYKYPTLFVHPNLLEAAMQTELPNDAIWGNCYLPYEAGVLLLPKDSIVHPTLGAFDMIGWGRLPKDTWLTHPLTRSKVMLETDSFVTYTSPTNDPMMQIIFNCADLFTPLITGNIYGYVHDWSIDIPVGDAQLSKEEESLMERIKTVFFSLMLYLEYQPMLKTEGKQIGFHKKSGQSLYTPTILG